MASTIFQELTRQKIARFIEEYKGARILHTNQLTGKIVHKGEFGALREKIVITFLKSFISEIT